MGFRVALKGEIVLWSFLLLMLLLLLLRNFKGVSSQFSLHISLM